MNKFILILIILNIILGIVSYFQEGNPSWISFFCGWSVAMFAYLEKI